MGTCESPRLYLWIPGIKKLSLKQTSHSFWKGRLWTYTYVSSNLVQRGPTTIVVLNPILISHEVNKPEEVVNGKWGLVDYYNRKINGFYMKKNSWLSVNLEDKHAIRNVIFMARTDCCPNFKSITVSVGDQPGTSCTSKVMKFVVLSLAHHIRP